MCWRAYRCAMTWLMGDLDEYNRVDGEKWRVEAERG